MPAVLTAAPGTVPMDASRGRPGPAGDAGGAGALHDVGAGRVRGRLREADLEVILVRLQALGL